MKTALPEEIKKHDVIVALSTPRGPGALALIRLTGDGVLSVVDPLARLPGGVRLSDKPSHTVAFGRIVDEQETILDQVLFIVMRGPRTFTGEDTIEISCHNNPFIIESIIQLFLRQGARMAQPGEFTRRAVENERITLVQAEAVGELIHAPTEMALKKALAQLEGSLAYWIESLEKRLLQVIALCEASFEFLEEDVDFRGQIRDLLVSLQAEVARARESFDLQRHIKEGFRIALIGTVNAGKSSLFNKLVGVQRAIVTPRPGTTRDTIEASCSRHGLFWTFIDTAGIRQTADEIEQEGIRRSLQEAARADVIVLVFDGTKELSAQVQAVYDELWQKHAAKIIVVKSKVDLVQVKLPEEFERAAIALSTVTGVNVDLLEQRINDKIQELLARSQTPFMMNKRLYHLLGELQQRLLEVQKLVDAPVMHYELISHELRSALESLAEMSGKTVSSKMLDLVFQEFCVGK
ncbi:MAG: tRNA uridine-5-carboxymethylaminomethyl(34) synthesis GTPase MnmE [Candidatus Babeliaceae bacterium]|nr:tRNA uridine-5-carboxymethylaminomethyl(34) synthesis GTPase MnmE [Candidatus Babeliaceae bacterium]